MMCGIFGLVTTQNSNYKKDFLINSLRTLAFLSESRGKDSSGLCVFNQIEKRIDVLKGPLPISNLFKQKKIKKAIIMLLILKILQYMLLVMLVLLLMELN